jgi:hypothetical protein
MNIPVSYAFLKAGAVPEVTVMVAIAISQICLFARLHMLGGMIGLSSGDFLKKVYLNLLLVSVVALVIPCAVNTLFPAGFWGFVASVAVCVCSAALSVALLGLSRYERREICDMIMKRFRS